MKSDQMPPEVRVRISSNEGHASEQSFTSDFRIGRDEACDVQVFAPRTSRIHAEVAFEDGHWWVRDLDSTNGTFAEGERIQRARLNGTTRLQLGRRGAEIQLIVGPEEPSRASQTFAAPQTEPARTGREPISSSVSRYIQRYFEAEGQNGASAGQHTRMIRQAFQRVQQKQTRRYHWIIGVVLVLSLGVGSYALVQHWQNERLQAMSQELFYQLRKQDVAISNLRRYVEETNDATLEERLAQFEEQQRKMAKQYEGYVRELGLRRELGERERLIYRVARIFNESEFAIPAGFVRRVQDEIRDYWLTPAGKRRFRQAIQRAEKKGYTPFIVKTMREYGLQPEFFYLALQESDFKTRAVGAHTRWGIAKGMWQFIPSTGRRYGLTIGPRADSRVTDPQDDRHDFRKSTKAAARYLQDVYSELAQASGLLVMASYNWGEHRVVSKMERLFEGIPQDPEERNYWRFLTTYEDRMPEQTKDYVLKIVSAAVIGQNPRQFGFDFDNPLRKHLRAPQIHQATAASPE